MSSVEVKQLESEIEKEKARLNLAVARCAWVDAKRSAGRLVELEGALAVSRARDERPADGSVSRIRVQG